jgi:hypothetical protein
MMAAALSYEDAAPLLKDRGFAPVPIRRGTKAPRPDNWQAGDPGDWERRFKREHVGLLTASTPAVDIDVRDEAAALALDRLAVETFGDGPLRIGMPPKRLRLYRTETRFTKLKTAGYRFPGDRQNDQAHAVEVLAAGQQFVAFALHPDTGRPYAWIDDSPLDLERQDLPELRPERIPAFLADAGRLLERHGARQKERAAGRSRTATDHTAGPAPRPVRSLSEVDRVFAALDCVDPASLDYDAWVRVAYGLKSAFGEDGRDIWLAWSAAPHGIVNPKDDPAVTLATWKGIRPDRCGWRYVERLMRDLVGASP